MLSVLEVLKGFSWIFFTNWLVCDSFKKKKTRAQIVLEIWKSSSQFQSPVKYEHFSRRSFPISANINTIRIIINRSWQIWKSDLDFGSREAYSERVLIFINACDPPIGDRSNRSFIAEKSELDGSKTVNSTKTAAVWLSIHLFSSNTLITFIAERELYPSSATYPPPSNIAMTPLNGLSWRLSLVWYLQGLGHSRSSSKLEKKMVEFWIVSHPGLLYGDVLSSSLV